MAKIPSINIISDRTMALRQAVNAVNYVNEHVVDFGCDTINPQAIA